MYYEIVPMDRGHVDQIAELERQCFSTPWSVTQLEDALYNDAACFIVAEDGEGGVLGYAGLHVILDEGYIDNVAVEEAARLLLKPGGLFLMEHGWLQGAVCRELCHEYFWSDVHTGLDLAGKDRFLFAVRTEKK